jgi:hypothetical protein
MQYCLSVLLFPRIFRQILLERSNEEDEVGRTFSMHGREAKCIHFFWEDCVKTDLELFAVLICNVEFLLCTFVINCVINSDLTVHNS